MQVFGSKFYPVLADQLAGIGVAFCRPDLALRRGQRHFYADAAGARAHIPQRIAGAYGELRQHGGAHLLLSHRRFAAQERFIRQAGHTA